MLWMRSGPATASTPDFSINMCVAPIYQLAWRAATWQARSRPHALAARRLFVIAIIVNAFFVSTASLIRRPAPRSSQSVGLERKSSSSARKIPHDLKPLRDNHRSGDGLFVIFKVVVLDFLFIHGR